MAGRVTGSALGVGATWGVCEFTGWEPAVSGASGALGIALAVAAGLQPASPAAGLDPIRALQER